MDDEISQVVAQDDTTTEDETVVEQKEDKRPSSVVKLLHQRNELKKQVEELSAKVTETDKLAKKMAELEEMVAKQALDSEAKTEKSKFFESNPVAKEYEAEIEKYKEKGLSYDEAFKLYAAQTNPTLLMDEQFRNKSTSTTNLTGVTKEKDHSTDNPESITDFKSDKEFWEWSEKVAKQSRSSQ
jgi:hypothetical protein